jgi:hypothetical protein
VRLISVQAHSPPRPSRNLQLKYRRAELRKVGAILSHLAEGDYKSAAIQHRQIENLARRAG